MDAAARDASPAARADRGASTASAAVRHALAPGSRRRLLAATLLLGLLAAAGVTAASKPVDRTFAAVSVPVQLVMSVLLPFLGVLLAADLRVHRKVRAAPTLLGAALLAAVVGVMGVLFCVVAVALTAAGAQAAGADPWRHAVALAAGGVVVEIVAQLVGVGLGLLLRPPVVAFLATIVLPLGVWLLLGLTGPLRVAREWLTPFATSSTLLDRRAEAGTWARKAVVVLVWVVGLTAAGLSRRRRLQDTPR